MGISWRSADYLTSRIEITMAKGDIHSLGLGLIKQITNQVENDSNISGIYDAIEPVAKDMMQEYFPTQMVEIHPLVTI